MLVLVAERDGLVVGYAYAGMEGNDYMALRGPAGLLYDLVVDPEHRRQGIGSALLKACFAGLRGLGAPRVVLFTAEKNLGAQALFDAAGFRRTMIEMTCELGED
jgi:ribosomal protein S18 acetylase RimI-like enzyme